MKMKAAVLREYKKLVVEEVELLSPKENEILIKYAASGIGPSDWNHILGNKPTPFPSVLGHEGAGIVQEVGKGVTHVKPGDHVAVAFIYSCGECAFCKSGRWSLCPEWGKMLHTGMLAGGTGMNTVQGCAVAGAGKVIAVDIDPVKLEMAYQFGATHTINTNEQDPVQAIKDLTNGEGVDNAFEVVGTAKAMLQAYQSLKLGGTCVLAGAVVSDPDLVIDSTRIPYEEKYMVGTSGGGMYAPRDIPRVANLYMQGRLKLKELVTKEYTLDQINEAFADLDQGKLLRGLIVYE